MIVLTLVAIFFLRGYKILMAFIKIYSTWIYMRGLWSISSSEAYVFKILMQLSFPRTVIWEQLSGAIWIWFSSTQVSIASRSSWVIQNAFFKTKTFRSAAKIKGSENLKNFVLWQKHAGTAQGDYKSDHAGMRCRCTSQRFCCQCSVMIQIIK